MTYRVGTHSHRDRKGLAHSTLVSVRSDRTVVFVLSAKLGGSGNARGWRLHASTYLADPVDICVRGKSFQYRIRENHVECKRTRTDDRKRRAVEVQETIPESFLNECAGLRQGAGPGNHTRSRVGRRASRRGGGERVESDVRVKCAGRTLRRLSKRGDDRAGRRKGRRGGDREGRAVGRVPFEKTIGSDGVFM